MAWRGQGGKRAKGRRGDQDPELDNTAWLEELEREAARTDDDDEEDWASTLRGRRSATPPPAAPPPQPPPDPGWDGPTGHRGETPGPTGWSADPRPDDTVAASDPDWSWRPPPGDAFGEPARADPDPGWDRYGEAARLDPAADAFGDPGQDAGAGAGWDGSPADAQNWSDPESGDDPREADAFGVATSADPAGGWRSAGVETPTGAWDPVEPVGREPDYPALFGELYRRSAAQQDPIWEAPFDQPLPEQGPPDPPAPAWPFEETTQSWEPSDRSFIWPSDELPSTQGEWDQPGSASWLDEPQAAAPAEPDQTAVWPGPGSRSWEEPAPEQAPESRSQLWADQPSAGNGVAPPAPPLGPQPTAAGGSTPRTGPPTAPQAGPPPDDWASAIPTDVPAARRAADPSATRAWRPDEAEAEPGVPLHPRSRRTPATPEAPSGGVPSGGPGLAGPPGTSLGAPAGPASRGRRPSAREAPGGTTDPGSAATRPRTGPRAAREAADELETARRTAPPDAAAGRRNRPAGERRARAWPRVVAIISWIVLLMVLCWYYVFPWLERVLPENF